MSRPGAVFLDRDGTINVKAPEGDYVKHPGELRLLPGAARAIRRLNDEGILTVVVTNQRGIALGRMTERDLRDVHEALGELLAAQAGARIDAFLHCPHESGTCQCRKPGTGMFLEAQRRFPEIRFASAVMVGDSPSDVEAGRALGMATLQVGRDVADLAGAVDQLRAAASAAS